LILDRIERLLPNADFAFRSRKLILDRIERHL